MMYCVIIYTMNYILYLREFKLTKTIKIHLIIKLIAF